jgi:hypothetical protein
MTLDYRQLLHAPDNRAVMCAEDDGRMQTQTTMTILRTVGTVARIWQGSYQ